MYTTMCMFTPKKNYMYVKFESEIQKYVNYAKTKYSRNNTMALDFYWPKNTKLHISYFNVGHIQFYCFLKFCTSKYHGNMYMLVYFKILKLWNMIFEMLWNSSPCSPMSTMVFSHFVVTLLRCWKLHGQLFSSEKPLALQVFSLSLYVRQPLFKFDAHIFIYGLESAWFWTNKALNRLGHKGI
jgi:hypothetical protein